jgi:hypothetical protein
MRSKYDHNSGRKFSEETKKKVGDASKLHWQDPEYREKVSKRISAALMGHKLPIEVRSKISLSSKGRIPWNKGITKTFSHSKETRLKMSIRNSGKNNPAWKGGLSYEPYCPKFNDKFKEYIRDKFGRICYLCLSTEEKNGARLCVHHIDYQKNDICNGKSWSLIPLCRSCHGKTTIMRHYYFNLLIYYWATNPEINLNINFYGL